ncbi:cytochrome P450 [Streptomyces sp. NPDC088350]|uniref:cytochrome P450 n=1 Tax=Streptomyces sp. NPDC088350 TaxID=3365854 RepID=UPI00381C64E0
MNLAEWQLTTRPLAFLDRHAHAPGAAVELRPHPQRRLLVWDPETVREVFRQDRAMRHPRSDTLGPLFGARSVVSAEGERHTALRSLLGGPLRHGRLVAEHHGTIEAVVREELERLPPDTAVSVSGWARRVTLRVIGRVVLGPAGDQILTPFRAWVDTALGSPARTLRYRCVRPHPALPSAWRTFLRERRRLERLLDDVRAEAGPGTVARLLRPYDRQEAADQLLTLLFAGHETTASAVAWTLMWLARDPELGGQVRDELSATSASGADAARVPLLDAVCRESLRLTPPPIVAGHRRSGTATGGDGEGGRGRPEVAPGTVYTPCVYLAHRHPDSHPDPLRFDPARFLGRPPPSCTYFPFGGGLRRCLGADLALVELRMVVAAAVRHPSLRVLNPEAGRPRLAGPAMAPCPALLMAVAA